MIAVVVHGGGNDCVCVKQILVVKTRCNYNSGVFFYHQLVHILYLHVLWSYCNVHCGLHIHMHQHFSPHPQPTELDLFPSLH